MVGVPQVHDAIPAKIRRRSVNYDETLDVGGSRPRQSPAAIEPARRGADE